MDDFGTCKHGKPFEVCFDCDGAMSEPRKRGWEKRFADQVNGVFSKARSFEEASAIKDVVYLLGVAIDREQYEFADGFKRFTDELGIVWKKGVA